MIASQNLSILSVLSLITLKRQVTHDRTASRSEWKDNYDFIVVGAGAAGCVVAKRLAENERINVLLLEAGGTPDAIYNDIPGLFTKILKNRPDLEWLPNVVPQKYANPSANITLRAGKTLGGSSSHNNMMFSRGHPKDYDHWEQTFGAKNWGFESVLPFFKRFENNLDKIIIRMSPSLHGAKGPVQITTPREPGDNLLALKRVFNLFGLKDTDINGINQTGTMIGQSFITTKGFRASASNSYIDPNPYPKNLHIVAKALVTKILFNGLTADGVEFEKNNKTYRVYAKREVIISAGAVNTAQLLMLSGVGPIDHLKQFNIPVILDLPVGNNFKIHPAYRPNLPYGPELTQNNLAKLYFKGTGPLAQAAFVPAFFSTPSNNDQNWPNIFMWGVLDPNDKIIFIPYVARLKSSGTIRLNSTNPYDQPLIDPNVWSDPQDFISAVESMQFIFKIKEHHLISGNVSYPSIEEVGCPPCPGLKDYECIEGINCFIKQTTDFAKHPSGTCRMGSLDRTDVVVDPQLRVKNANHLRVCDASIMPDIPNANLYAPSLMIGEKCSQIIKDYHKM